MRLSMYVWKSVICPCIVGRSRGCIFVYMYILFIPHIHPSIHTCIHIRLPQALSLYISHTVEQLLVRQSPSVKQWIAPSRSPEKSPIWIDFPAFFLACLRVFLPLSPCTSPSLASSLFSPEILPIRFEYLFKFQSWSLCDSVPLIF